MEIAALEKRGCVADDWAEVEVSDGFCASQLWASRLEGHVYIGRGARIINSTVKNYIIGCDAHVEGVARLECRTRSSFGNGVSVATVNENGGRAVKIYDTLTAQVAYIWAMFRHRTLFCERMAEMAESYAAQKSAELGQLGEGSKIIGAGLIREVCIGRGVTIEGASLIENATLCDGAYVGVDVKLRDTIAVEGATIDTGATLQRCFVGESAVVANGFTVVDSLVFANSHLENGEAASIFAAPYTVSHHKSSLLIAGLFSFFNAGSGSNQSNHLFKTGAVHQAIHPRGVKFASGAYIMAPAVEGAYTMVKGHHVRHHDTLDFPFSYLVEDAGRSVLMPGANLTSYGTFRDIEKWGARDRRKLFRDELNFEEYNPYITQMLLRAVNAAHTLQESQSEEYIWNRVVIKPAHLRRGLGFYNKAIVASLGAMLDIEEPCLDSCGSGEWVDAAGQYITLDQIEGLISRVESREVDVLSECAAPFRAFARNYTSHAYAYAYALLSQLLGRTPTSEDISEAIASAKSSREGLRKLIESDGAKDCSLSMAVGYGLHDSTPEADYRAVRSLP